MEWTRNRVLAIWWTAALPCLAAGLLAGVAGGFAACWAKLPVDPAIGGAVVGVLVALPVSFLSLRTALRKHYKDFHLVPEALPPH